ncbi:hypothetical protein PFISCL1PPCAC_12017, partial [Pristionchus fissidentatus]
FDTVDADPNTMRPRPTTNHRQLPTRSDSVHAETMAPSQNAVGASSSSAAPLPAASAASPAARLLITLREREEERAVRLGGHAAASRSLPERAAGYCGRRERDRQAGWIVAVACTRLRLHVDAASSAVAILDEVLARKGVPCKMANCLAAAALYIARKLWEEGDETPELFLDTLGLEYSANELRRMEMVVLDVLGWDVLLPSVERFASAQLQLLGYGWMLPCLRPSIEAVLVRGVTMRHYRASSLALAVVSLSLERLVPHHWLQATHTICGVMKTEPSSLISVRESVSALLPATAADYGHRNPYAPLLLTPDESDAEEEGERRAVRLPQAALSPSAVPRQLAAAAAAAKSSLLHHHHHHQKKAAAVAAAAAAAGAQLPRRPPSATGTKAARRRGGARNNNKRRVGAPAAMAY